MTGQNPFLCVYNEDHITSLFFSMFFVPTNAKARLGDTIEVSRYRAPLTHKARLYFELAIKMIFPSFNLLHYLAAIFIIGPILLKLPAVKGAIGEWKVHFLGKLFLDKKLYHLIRDVTFPTEDGTTKWTI